LHASRLSFVHPTTSERVSVCAALPADLAGPFERMGLLQPALSGTTGPVWAPGPTDLPVLCSDEPPPEEPLVSPAPPG
jgi:hypothetical protein